MAATWQFRLMDTTGAMVAVIDRWTKLVLQRQINGVDLFALELPESHTALPFFEQDGMIEGWWRDLDNGIAWHREFEAFCIDPHKWTDAKGNHHLAWSGRGYADLLARTIIDTFAGSAASDKNGPGETVLKEYVDEQAGPGAGARARAGLAIQADAATGLAWDGQRSNQNLLDVLAQIAESTGLYFWVVGTGPATFEFQVSTATDRTATVVFSEAFANMAEANLSELNSGVLNWIKVGGQGEGAARVFEYRQDAPSIALTPWNQREAFQIATDQDTVAKLQARGDEKLAASTRSVRFTFNPVQVPSLLYGRDYFLGDLVTAVYDGVTYTRRIQAVTFTVDESGSWPEVATIDA